MRGGALPILVWGSLLALSGATNAVWTGYGVQIAEFGGGVGFILIVVITLTLRSRGEALRKGEPKRRPGHEAIVNSSTGAVAMAIGLATVLYGLTFGHFFIYLGCGIVVAGIGRLLLERFSQARTERNPVEHPPRPGGGK